MKYLIYALAVVLLLGINLGVLGSLSLAGYTPNLLLIFCMLFALEKKEHDFFFVGFFSGLILDFFSTSFFGTYLLALLCVLFLLNLLVQNFVVFELNWKSATWLLFGSLTLYNFFAWLYGMAVYKLNLAARPADLASIYHGFFWIFFYDWLLFYPMYRLYFFVRRLAADLLIKSRGYVK